MKCQRIARATYTKVCGTLPCPTLPYPTLPYPALPCPALPSPALPCPALPYLTVPSPSPPCAKASHLRQEGRGIVILEDAVASDRSAPLSEIRAVDPYC